MHTCASRPDGLRQRQQMNEFQTIIGRAANPSTYPMLMATLVEVQGSSYRRIGARLMIDRSGGRVGSISGGCLEEDVVARLRQLQERQECFATAVYDTTTENDLVWGVGLGCHSVVRVVLERWTAPPPWLPAIAQKLRDRQSPRLWIGWEGDFRGTHLPSAAAAPANVYVDDIAPPPALLICGAGDDAIPLTQFAKQLGWTVHVMDPRPAFATSERFPLVDTVRVLAPEQIRLAYPFDDRTAAVIMTHHYRFDRPLLAGLLPLSLPYLGLLGPRQRAVRLLAEVRDLTDASVSTDPRLHAPVGLDLGGDGPAAVALAIVAEIQAVLHARNARPLRDRDRPIHAVC
ncbi:MAG TPA: XdhC family protein [Candidatus Synoicihabitans sp.]|nr:XdhC family protein [Candidatus Synoicihabitans sp.]